MADQNKIAMYSPDGTVGYVPASDYDKAVTAGGERAVSFHAPSGAQGWVRQKDVLKALDAGGYIADQSFLGTNAFNQGTYKMTGPDGKVVPVPYSFVGSAAKAGLKMADADRKTYVRDAAADPSLGPDMIGRNSAGQPIFGTKEPKQQGSAVGRFLSSAGGAIKNAAAGALHGIADEPSTPEELAIEAAFPNDPIQARAALIAYRLGVAPAIEQGKEAVGEFKQSAPTSLHPTQEQLWHRQKAAGHALAAVVPGVGPWAAQVGEQAGEQAGAGNVAGAAGTMAGNAALYEAPHLIGEGVGLAAKTPRATLEAVTETSPRTLRTMAEDLAKKNKAAVEAAKEANAKKAEEHLEATQEALHKTRGAELEHEQALKTAEEKAKESNKTAAEKHLEATQEALHETKGKELEHQAKIKAEAEAAKAKHAADTAKVVEGNARVVAKHQADVERINQENLAAEHALDLRRTEEAKLQQETTAYYAKEDAVKANVKAQTDAVWQPWHDKMKGVTIDGGQIATPLERIAKVSPEVKRQLNQLIPDPSDAPPDSMYAKDRAAVMQAQGYDPKDYWNLPPDKRATIDQICASNGFEPEPIDFDPTVGVGIPIEQVHRAKSIIGRNVASGKYEGPLLGEMKQLGKVLEQAETRASIANGADADLKAGRKATREYMEAFGRERHLPKTQDEIRKQQANPEQFKEDNDQERLDAAKKHDPTLASDYESVKAHREQIKKMKTEDELRKSLQQVPQPPSLDDLREGYRLKPLPNPPEPPQVEEPARAVPPDRPALVQAEPVKPPLRTAPPDRPEEVKPKVETISPENYAAIEKEKIRTRARWLRDTGLRRALYATMTGLSFDAVELLSHMGAVTTERTALAAVAAGGVVLAGSHLLANLVERPDVTAWLSKITPKDAAVWEKLPPEQKALFTSDMKALVKEADKEKKPVSPALRAFVVGSAASQRPTLQDLKKQSEQLKPTPPAPGPQGSTAKPAWTHIYDPQTNSIVPV